MCGKLKEGSFAEIADFAAAGKPVRWSEKLYSKKKISTRLLPKRPSRSEPNCKNSRKGKESSYLFAKDCAKEARRLTPYIELLFEAADRYSDLLAAQKREKKIILILPISST